MAANFKFSESPHDSHLWKRSGQRAYLESGWCGRESNVWLLHKKSTQQAMLLSPLKTINKFFEPTEMNADSFFARWKNLSGDQQRAQKVFKAQQPLDLPGARNKLTGFGMQLLDNVDPNPDNMVCAGIIHTQTQQVGCLLRLEPNKQAQMFRLTIRASKESVTRQICELLTDQF
ncbi:AP-2 complex subunit alpha-like [Glossina fuscipes]|uniref:AP-2 complex subunit alpha-like n=1 Tax=Glossina fuscipes TaxID=7396 RepID=A0A9C6DWX3_9MUSC|nr:AP-2 complex subunit alpha-like [Glossina fuscipes]